MASTSCPARRRKKARSPSAAHTLDLAARTLSFDGKSVTLTSGEFSLLRVFAQHPRQPLAREKLMVLARGRDHEVFDRAIDVQVSRLRKLVEPDPANPRYIQTVWGFGYVYMPDSPETGDNGGSGARAATPRDGCCRARCSGASCCCSCAVVALAVLASIVLFRARAHEPAQPPAYAKRSSCSCRRYARRSRRPTTPSAAKRSRSCRASTACTIQLESDRPMRGQPPGGPFMRDLAERLREQLGPETEIRFAPRLQMLFVRVVARRHALLDRRAGAAQLARRRRAAARARSGCWSWLALLLIAAFVFARYLARPLRQLTAAVERVGRGELAPPLPETGPSEIAAVNRGFNAMTANLPPHRGRPRGAARRRVARPAHAARAAAPRHRDDRARRRACASGLVADIEEMDRIIGQFLDFARSEDGGGMQATRLDALVGAAVERYLGAGRNVTFKAGDVPPLPVSATAISRVVANLIDNALAYGAPPVEVSTSVDGRHGVHRSGGSRSRHRRSPTSSA